MNNEKRKQEIIKELRENTNVIVTSDWTGEGLLTRPPLFVIKNPVSFFWSDMLNKLSNPVIECDAMVNILKTRDNQYSLSESEAWDIIYAIGNEVWREETNNGNLVGNFKIVYTKENSNGDTIISRPVTEVITSLAVAEERIEALRLQHNAEYGALYGSIRFVKDNTTHYYHIAKIVE
jgi:hypothetical protein